MKLNSIDFHEYFLSNSSESLHDELFLNDIADFHEEIKVNEKKCFDSISGHSETYSKKTTSKTEGFTIF